MFTVPHDTSSMTPPLSRSRNRLLAALPLEDYQRIAPTLRSVVMKMKQVFHKQDAPIQDVYFPGGGAFSLVRTLGDGQAAEVATIGAEGVIGASVFFGQRIAEYDAVVQLQSSDAQVMSADALIREMERKGAFYNLVIRYNQALMSQIMQTAACNSLHSAEQRCRRWLLMTHDRAGADEFPLTHEFLAMMLGVRRPTVTLVVASLERDRLIHHRRGLMKIIDRNRLEAAACECYRAVTNQMTRLLPEVRAAVS